MFVLHIERRPQILVLCEREAVKSYVALIRNLRRLKKVPAAALGLVAALVVLILSIPILIILLSYVNALFAIFATKIKKELSQISQHDAINKHLVFERHFHALHRMRRSRLLFESPILGGMNKKFYLNIALLERRLRRIAYPCPWRIPANLRKHNLKEGDRWQNDLDLFSENEIIKLS